MNSEAYPETDTEADPEVISKEKVCTRLGRVIIRLNQFMAVTKISRSEWKEKHCETAIKQELTQLFQEFKALGVIKRAEISKCAKVLKSHMFLVH